jgi:polysaccharide export outer membrane protein
MQGPAATNRGTVAAIAVLLAGAISCSHGKDFLWVDEVPPGTNAPAEAYLIKPGDVIGVRVWNQEANSVERTRVRDDGKISLPFLNDVEVAGQEPAELARRLQVKLKTLIVNPMVTVTVHERPPLRVSVLGEVARPGMYDLEAGAGVLHAIAAAGGVTPFADSNGVFVLRRGYWADGNPSPARIRFRYRDLRHGKVPAANFRLRTGDVVDVE